MLQHTRLVFTSTTGRSGTGFLAAAVNRNALNATAEHDPMPRGYGEPRIWRDEGQDDKLRRLAQQKLARLAHGQRLAQLYRHPLVQWLWGTEAFGPWGKIGRRLFKVIPKCPVGEVYVESTHAFIKTYADAICALHHDVHVVHIVRDPLVVARSFCNRGSIPAADNPYLLDPDSPSNLLTAPGGLTDYQKCLWYCLESDARHQAFVRAHPHVRVHTIQTAQLGDPASRGALFEALGIEFRRPLQMEVYRNANAVASVIDAQDEDEASTLLARLAPEVLARSALASALALRLWA